MDKTLEKLQRLRDAEEIVPTPDLIKAPNQIKKIRESAKLNTAVLDHVEKYIRPGMSTEEIDRLVYDYTTSHGARPAPLGFEGYPKSVCTSVNNQICHGIPDENVILREGDIVNVDVSTCLDGYYSDASRTFAIGRISERAERILRVTKECVDLGVKAIRPWGHMGDVSHAIHSHALKHGYFVVEDIGGHGIGLEFHEEPYICYTAPKGTEMVLVPGMIFTIEPMLNETGPDFYTDEGNGWTTYTLDSSLSVQVEYTVLVTEDGAEILSR